MARRSGFGSIIAAVFMVAVLGCGGDDSTAGTSTTTDVAVESTTSTSTVTTSTTEAPPATTEAEPASEEEQILDAYRRAWANVNVVLDPPDPGHPALDELHTGEVRDNWQAYAADLLARGRADRGGHQLEPVLESVEGDRAVITDCYRSQGDIVDRATGEVVESYADEAQIRMQMQRVDGIWKQAAYEVVAEGCPS